MRDIHLVLGLLLGISPKLDAAKVTQQTNNVSFILTRSELVWTCETSFFSFSIILTIDSDGK